MFGQHPGYFKAIFLKQTRIIIVSIYKYTVYIMLSVQMIFFISTHLMVKHGCFRSLSMPKKEIVSIPVFEHLLRLSLRGHLALDLLPDLDKRMQRFLSSFESFQSTGHRQMSQEQYGQTSP
jgi:hypothetical protein